MQRHLTATDVFYSQDGYERQDIADTINSKTITLSVAGTAANGTVTLPFAPSAIVAALAYVTSSGAPATKALLAATTDYTLSGNILTFVTAQTGNTVILHVTQ